METIVGPSDGAGEHLANRSGRGFQVSDYILDRERTFAARPSPSLWGYLSPVIAELKIAGHRHPPRVFHTGDYRLICPNVDLFRKSNERVVIRALHFSKEKFVETLGDAATDLETRFGPLQRYAFRSELLRSVVDRLHDVTTNNQQGDTLYTDSLINTAILELWRLSGGGFQDLASSEKKLSSAMLRKINRYIDDNCLAKIDVAALARVADMPAALFQTAFRASTGRTPYQHILARRVATARCLVESSSLSLAEIAFRTGFSSQSHMTDVFKAKLGVTPGGLRRASL